jgi:hypothetical protein
MFSVILFVLTKHKFVKISIFLLSVIFIILLFIFRTHFIHLNYIFPPRDLYKNLIEIDLDVSKVGKYRMEFKHKYSGKYSIVLFPEKVLFDEYYKINYKLNLRIISDETFNISFDKNSEKNRFWGRSGINEEFKCGLTVFKYFVPKDLQKNKTVMLEIEVVKPDKEFMKLYGNTKLVVKKNTDPIFE